MKRQITIIGIAALLATTTCAQTNAPSGSFLSGLETMASAVVNAKNWTVLGGYGRGLHGSKNLAFEDVAYNFTENVGLLVGLDQLWAAGKSQNNTVRGGVTLSAKVHPFAFLGSTVLTNMVATPFVSDCVATGYGGDSVANVLATGMNFDIVKIGNFEVISGFFFEKRTGQSDWDGDYLAGFAGISRRF